VSSLYLCETIARKARKGFPENSSNNRVKATRKSAATNVAKPRAAARRDTGRHDAMLAVLTRFRVLVRSTRDHYRRVQRACGVSGAYVWAMAEIAAAPGMTVSELARRLSIHQSTASNMIEKLEASRFAERRRAREDKRVVRLYLTGRGRRAIARAPAPLRGALQEGLMRLPMSALIRLQDDLERLLREMHAHHEGDRTLLLARLLGGKTAEDAVTGRRKRGVQRARRQA